MLNRRISFVVSLMRASVAIGGLLAGGVAAAQPQQEARPASSEPERPAEADGPEIVVTADRVGLLEKTPNDTVFGLSKPLIETPRSASFVSETTLDRYGIQTLDKLTAISPGTYTASYFGIAGAVQIRGTLAENYFRGFKRIENKGTFSTPIGGAAELQILRGPPAAVFGPGKIGGLVNFIPKSATKEGKYLTEATGEITLTAGSYKKKNATAQIGLPVSLGGVQGGIYAYGEVEDSHSFYRGINPRRQLGEISVDLDLGSDWSVAFGGMAFHSKGDIQTPGWNRLTQDLIDNQTYITGRNTTLVDANGNGRLEPTEISPGGTYPFTTSLYKGYFGFPPAADPRFVLDTGFGTTKLSPRTVFVSDADFSRTSTYTFYFDLVKSLGDNSQIKLQQFYDSLDNERFVSYGYPADYRSWTAETRLSFTFPLDLFGGALETKNLIGASYRTYKGRKKESYNSGLLSLDRRDLAFGPTATDIFDSPFDNQGGLGWETDVKSRWNDFGVFLTTDIVIGGLNVILGGRYDSYYAKSKDLGVFVFGPAELKTGVDGKKDKFTYSASATYKLPGGFMPYVTYARSAALEVEQAGDIRPSNIPNSFVSDSSLIEGGVKFQLFDNTLLGALNVYRQKRTQLGGLASIVQPTIGKGFEYEFRWLASDNLSFTLVGNIQKTRIVGPDKSTIYLPARIVGVSPQNGFGGAYLTFDFSKYGGVPGDYINTLVPKSVVSAFTTYTSDRLSWGRWGATAGVSRASKTSGILPGAVVYPSYAVANFSLFADHGPWNVTLNVDNLFDKLYFTPDAGVIADLGALPSRGREWRVTLKHKF